MASDRRMITQRLVLLTYRLPFGLIQLALRQQQITSRTAPPAGNVRHNM